MHESIRTVAQMYAVNTALFGRALEGFEEGALRRQLAPGVNPPLWIAGHLASVRFGICALMGDRRENPLGKTFVRGAELDVEALPGVDLVRQAWTEATALLQRNLEDATPELLAQPSARKFPIEDPSLRGAVTFLCWHEGFHLGQMSLLRRYQGLPGLAG